MGVFSNEGTPLFILRLEHTFGIIAYGKLWFGVKRRDTPRGQHIKKSKIILYQTDEGKIKVNVYYAEESFWLTQKAIGELFNVDRSVITKHLKNIFAENELNEEAVCAKFAHTAEDGKTYNTNYYNLDAIIAVGYRVNSKKATQFRIWATQTLKEYRQRICIK